LNNVLQSQHIGSENVFNANIRGVTFLCKHMDILLQCDHACCSGGFQFRT
jgi:hypothetical protein